MPKEKKKGFLRKVGRTLIKAAKDVAKVPREVERILDQALDVGNNFIDKTGLDKVLPNNGSIGVGVSSGGNGGVNLNYRPNTHSPAIGIGVDNNGTPAAFVNNQVAITFGPTHTAYAAIAANGATVRAPEQDIVFEEIESATTEIISSNLHINRSHQYWAIENASSIVNAATAFVGRQNYLTHFNPILWSESFSTYSDKDQIKASIDGFLIHPENRWAGPREETVVSDVLRYAAGRMVGGLRSLLRPVEMLAQANNTGGGADFIHSGTMPEYDLYSDFKNLVANNTTTDKNLFMKVWEAYRQNYNGAMEESKLHMQSGNHFMSGFTSGIAQADVIVDAVSVASLGYGAIRVAPTVARVTKTFVATHKIKSPLIFTPHPSRLNMGLPFDYVKLQNPIVNKVGSTKVINTSLVPNNPSGYSVFYEYKLSKNLLGRSDAVHFNRSNAALESVLKNNPEYAAYLESISPKLMARISAVGGRRNPYNMIWHHDLEEGVMQLVCRMQHMDAKFQNLFHPNKQGGYKIWAIPNGAPKRLLVYGIIGYEGYSAYEVEAEMLQSPTFRLSIN